MVCIPGRTRQRLLATRGQRQIGVFPGRRNLYTNDLAESNIFKADNEIVNSQSRRLADRNWELSPDGSRVYYAESVLANGPFVLYTNDIFGLASIKISVPPVGVGQGRAFNYAGAPDNEHVVYLADHDTVSLKIYANNVLGTDQVQINAPHVTGAEFLASIGQ